MNNLNLPSDIFIKRPLPESRECLFVDFETAWQKGSKPGVHSLRVQPVAEYVRDERFAVHGMGWCVGDGEPEWAFGEDVERAVRGIDWSGCVVAHNAMFDAAVLKWGLGVTAGRWLDTAGMVRYSLGRACPAGLDSVGRFLGLGEKAPGLAETAGLTREDWGGHEEVWEQLGVYCRQDVALMREVYRVLRESVPAVEGAVMDLTVQAFVERGFRLDFDVAARAADEGLGPVGRLRSQGRDDLADQLAAVVGSNDRMKAALEGLGVACPMKVSPTTGKPIPALAKSDGGLKALLRSEDPRVVRLAEARVEVKGALNRTRSGRFLTVASKHSGYLPIELKYCGAHTGRWSGAGKSNLQNLPRGGSLRKSMVAPPGWKVLVVDLAQIEARVLACVAGEEGLLQSFRDGEDVYAVFGGWLYGVEGMTKDSHPTERQIAKSAVLGCGYGLGGPGFKLYCEAMGIDISEDQAVKTVRGYREHHPRITALWDTMEDSLHIMTEDGVIVPLGEVLPQRRVLVGHEHIRLPSGRPLVFAGLNRRGKDWYCRGVGKEVKVYGGLLTENLIQAMARDVMVEGLMRIRERQGARGLRLRFVLTVHDEVVFLVEEDAVEAARAFALECMTEPVSWLPGCPIGAEAGVGGTYGGAK